MSAFFRIETVLRDPLENGKLHYKATIGRPARSKDIRS